MENNLEQSFGEKAVRLGFNPSTRDAVFECKKKFADLIDQLDNLRKETPNPEVGRTASIAITEMETACMWAVKALTINLR